MDPHSLTVHLDSRKRSQLFEDGGANDVNTAVICSTSGKAYLESSDGVVHLTDLASAKFFPEIVVYEPT